MTGWDLFDSWLTLTAFVVFAAVTLTVAWAVMK